MSGRLARLIERGALLLESADPEPPAPSTATPGRFIVDNLPVDANFAGGDESLVLTTTGGQQEHFRGTLVISRVRYPAKPTLMSVITMPDGTRARIAGINSDNASWTLLLTSPNARH